MEMFLFYGGFCAGRQTVWARQSVKIMRQNVRGKTLETWVEFDRRLKNLTCVDCSTKELLKFKSDIPVWCYACLKHTVHFNGYHLVARS